MMVLPFRPVFVSNMDEGFIFLNCCSDSSNDIRYMVYPFIQLCQRFGLFPMDKMWEVLTFDSCCFYFNVMRFKMIVFC